MRHDKLVRDNIPAIIMRQGEHPVTRTLDRNEYKRELRRKLQEEVDEFCETGRPEELADILEVVYALASEVGISPSQLEHVRQQKLVERGGFSQRIYLVETCTTEAAG